MTAFIRFFDKTTGVILADDIPESMDVSFSLGSSPNWKAKFTGNSAAMQLVQEGNLVEIYVNGELILEGSVQTFSRGSERNKVEFDLDGRGLLDGLYDYRANSQAYSPPDTPLLVILGELLRRGGWRIGEIHTLADPEQTLSVDLRAENRLLSQIQKALEGIPVTFYREGKKLLGDPSLDIGTFREESGLLLTTFPDDSLLIEEDRNIGRISNIDVVYESTEIVEAIEAIGGDLKDDSSVTRAINLGDALAADPTLATDPDFPIIEEIAGYVYSVRNMAIYTGSGPQTVERFTQYAPEKETGDATAAAIEAAGLALYKRAVAYLKDHQENVTTYSLTAIGKYLKTKVGDLADIQATVRMSVVDPFTNYQTVVFSSVDTEAQVTKLSLKLQGGELNWSLTLTEGDGVLEEDFIVSIYDETKQKDPPAGAAYIPAFPPELGTISHTQTGGDPDSMTPEGLSAIDITLTLPAAPVGATDVYMAGVPFGVSANGEVKVEILADPVFGGDGPKLRLWLNNIGWNSGYSADITSYLIWI